MTVGRIWPAEISEFTDPLSGVAVCRLTAHRGHSHHVYFTNPGCYDDGKRLLISSDRENRANLFGLKLATGELTQLTYLEPLPLPREVEFLRACASTTNDEAYY